MDSLPSRLWHITGLQRRVFKQFLRPWVVLSALTWLRCYVAVTWALDSVFFPGYKKKKIDRPVFLVGNPRSGTTFLHRFLADQGDLVGYRVYEMLVPSLTGQMLIRPFLPLLKAFNPAKHHGSDAHQTSFDALETDDLAIFARFIDGVFLYGYFLSWDDPDPSFMFEQFEPGSASTDRDMAFYKQCLQRNLHRSGKARVLGKLFTFPPRLEDALRHFPDAKFIYMVRDPAATMPSGMSLLTGVQDQHFGVRKLPQEVQKRFFQRLYVGLSLLFTRFVDTYRDKKIPEDNLLIVRYPDLMQDFEGTMNRILEFAELEPTEEYRQRIHETSEKQKSRESKHKYSLEEYHLSAQGIVDDMAEVYREFDLDLPEGTTLPDRSAAS
jgi:omega-hydroxy-beta-dihydromenaquinone-9 sulfotransferase